ncbi:MAG: hypothetical protein IPM88_15580 [Nitrospira sp.]|nr:hypothetical protein [Nitrospira sp.]
MVAGPPFRRIEKDAGISRTTHLLFERVFCYPPVDARHPPSLHRHLPARCAAPVIRPARERIHAERLAFVVFSISLPATILVSLDRVVFAPTAWKLPLAACLVTLSMLFCSWPVARLLHLPRATRGGFLLGTGCINSVYFAYPVVLATLGDKGLAQAILFDLGQTTLTLTVIYGLAVWHGARSATARSVMLRFVSSPPLWALCLSLLLTLLERHLPGWLHDTLTPIHLTTTPLASLVLGLSISFSADCAEPGPQHCWEWA